MLFRRPFLEGLADGRITLAFRKWRRPSVRAGGTLHTAAGLLSIDVVTPIAHDAIGKRDAKRAGFDSLSDLLTELDEQREGTLYRIELHRLGDDPRISLRERASLDEIEYDALHKKLARLDRASPAGPWTLAVLRAVAAHPAMRAADLAASLGIGLDRAALKLNVRKLKNLGLTESLGTGYRISPRGRTLLERIG